MKIRSDFVSNSSSSSFIIRDRADFFDYFGITKDDIVRAIYTLKYGNDFSELIDKIVKDALENHTEELKKAKESEDTFHIKYHSDAIKDIKKNGSSVVTGVYVYDMFDKEDANKCIKEWKCLFSGWDAPNEGQMSSYRNFVDSLDRVGIHNWGRYGYDVSKEYYYYDEKHGAQVRGKVPESIKKSFSDMRKICGIKTMFDVAKDISTRFVFHFADNEVWSLTGMASDTLDYITESYTTDRFYEILMKELIRMKGIDLNDPRNIDFKEFWEVPADHWWKRHESHKDRKYFTDSRDDTLSWKDIVDDSFDENSIGHEG